MFAKLFVAKITILTVMTRLYIIILYIEMNVFYVLHIQLAANESEFQLTNSLIKRQPCPLGPLLTWAPSVIGQFTSS